MTKRPDPARTANDPGETLVLGPELGQGFFSRDPRTVAEELLGAILVSTVDGERAAGLIVETEAYLGVGDPGSHASTRGVTERNRVMYGEPGSVYVYFTYGMHHMLNLVAEPEGTAGAVLVRALEPLAGIDGMTARRAGRAGAELTNGPGKVAQALGVDLSDNGTRLGEGRLSVHESVTSRSGETGVSGRIGLGEGHELPLRYYLVDNPYVSRAKPGRRVPKGRPSRQGAKGTRRETR
jgi:DNA-3-methyladenine glycosylase